MPDIENIEEIRRIEERINAAIDEVGNIRNEAEKRAADTRHEENIARWESGRAMLKNRVGKKLPPGVLAQYIAATGKGRSDTCYRMQFAEQYPTEEALSNALDNGVPVLDLSWIEITKNLPKLKSRPRSEPGSASMPRRHARHDEVMEFHRQGLSSTVIEAKTGIRSRTVRFIVGRERLVQEAKAEQRQETKAEQQEPNPPANWVELLPPKVREREVVMRRIIRKEVEAEIEPRVQEAVSRRLEAAAANIRMMQDQSQRVLRGRKGVFTKAGWDLIRSSLHPDSRLSISDEKLAKAFRVFNEAEILLLNEADSPTLASTLPSYEELLKRRQR